MAALPWYNFAPVRPILDELWSALAERLDSSAQLDHREDYAWHWSQPNLLLGQACGLDIAWGNPNSLQVVATPRFSWPGCEGVHHRSYVLVKENGPRSLQECHQTRCAINSPSSQSGALGLASLMTQVGSADDHESFFAEVVISGSHWRSLELLHKGEVDVVAIDCITYEIVHRNFAGKIGDLHLDSLHCLANTAPALCPPFVTSGRRSEGEVSEIRKALEEAIHSINDRLEPLGLVGVEASTNADYSSQESLRRQVGAELCALR